MPLALILVPRRRSRVSSNPALVPLDGIGKLCLTFLQKTTTCWRIRPIFAPEWAYLGVSIPRVRESH